jgi:iron complex outermembrane receptor protein
LKDDTIYEQVVTEGVISGDLFDLPAGSVSAAFGGQFRWDKINDLVDPQQQFTPFGPTLGRFLASEEIWELFGEVGVPILRDAPLADRLDVVGSVRMTSNPDYGKNVTYKTGLDWQVTPEWRLRGSYGTSFRAPALFERFRPGLGRGGGSQFASDPCTLWENSGDPVLQANCQAAGIPMGYFSVAAGPSVTTAGNPDLVPETSRATNVGLIWTPEFADLSIAADYWTIKIDEQVNIIGAFNVVLLCYQSADFPNDPFCAKHTRDANPASPTFRQLLVVQDNFFNVSQQRNQGVDIAFRYGEDVLGGRINVNSTLTFILEDKLQNFEGQPFTDRKGQILFPDFAGNANISYTQDGWTAFYGVQMVGGGDNAIDGVTVGTTNRFPGMVERKFHTEMVVYHDVSLSKSFGDRVSLRFGVQNLLDREPPVISAGTPGLAFRRGVSALGNWDMVGRRAFVSLSTKF